MFFRRRQIKSGRTVAASRSSSRLRGGARHRWSLPAFGAEQLEERRLLASVVINGGDGSQWLVNDDIATDNGLPTGGNFTTVSAGSGASINDASLPGQGDAFDGAAMVWVDNTQVVGALTQTGQTVSFAPSVIAGLNAALEYYFDPNSATQRTYLELNNPTGSPITVSVDYASNFGSDSGTQVNATSSGDLVFTTADNWIVTSDGGPFDPVNTTVIFGPGSPSVTPTSVSQTVFSAAGTQGVLATYSVTVPAGATRGMMFFQQLDATVAGAISDAAAFNAYPIPDDFLVGLTSAQRANIVNWQLAPDPLGTLYFSVDFDANGLFFVDPQTGAANPVGAGVSGVTGGTVGLTESGDLSFLYGSSPFGLRRINTDGTGSTQIGTLVIEGLAFDPTTATLYGAINGAFFTIDPATGTLQTILAAPGEDVEGLEYANGFIYGLAAGGNLHRYDIAADTWTIVGSTGVAFDQVALAYNPWLNVLYAKGDQNSNLYGIDPDTAAATIIGDTGIANGGGLTMVTSVVLNGDANANDFLVRLDAGGNNVEVYIDGNPAAGSPYPLANLATLVINGLAGDDSLTVDYVNGPVAIDIYFQGGADDDRLAVIGTGVETAVYTPDVAATGDGVVTIDGRTISFTGLEPVDISGMATATLALPLTGGNDTLQIDNGFDFATGLTPALVVTGTTGDTTAGAGDGVAIEAVAFFNNGTVVIDTTVTDGDDRVTVVAADGVASDNTNLLILTGVGDDIVAIEGVVDLAGDLTIGAPVIVLDTPTIVTGANQNYNGAVLIADDVTLDADHVAFNGTVDAEAQQYFVSLVALDFEDISGTGTSVALGDDIMSAAIPLGFDFEFFGVTYTQLFISSNGFLSFLGGTSGCCTGQPIPTASAPNGFIAGWWEDLDPPETAHFIGFEVLGTAPNRRFVVDFQNVGHFSDGNNPSTFEFKLFEGTNVIEVHYQLVQTDGGPHTAGIEDHTGTQGVEFFHGTGTIPNGTAVRYTPVTSNLVVNAAGSVTFGDVVGGVQPLDSLEVNIANPTGPFTFAHDVTVVNDLTVTVTDLAATNDEHIEVAAGVTVTSQQGSIGLRAGDDISLASTATLAAAGTISLSIDYGNADPGVGAFAYILAELDAIAANVFGNVDDDTFIVRPDDNTPINIDGDDPVLPTQPGDSLLVDLAGVVNPVLTVTAPGAGVLSSDNRADVTAVSIESFDVTNGQYKLVIDTVELGVGDDAAADTITLELDPTGTVLEVIVNGASVFADELANISAICVFGSSDDDTLVVDNANGLINRRIDFDAYDGFDTLVIQGDPGAPILRETYRVGATEDAGEWILDPNDNAGANPDPGDFDGDEQYIVFSGLDPVDTTTPAVTFDVILTAGADDLTIEDGGLLLGFNTTLVTDNGGTFETFRFANKTDVRINGLDGADLFTVNHPTASDGLATLSLFGHDITGADPTDDDASDSFTVQATAAQYVTNIFGGGGNDTIVIGNAANSLDEILGVVNVSGEAHLDGAMDPTNTLTIKGETNTLFVGDTLIVNDQGDPDSHTYDLTATTIDRTGAATINYDTIETLFLSTSVGAATVNVVSTMDEGMTSIGTQAAADTINVTTTGEAAIVTIATGGGDDTVVIATTGAGAFVQVNGGDGDDTITLQSNGGLSAINNLFSHTELSGDAGEDIINVWATLANTGVQLNGGGGNDTFNLGSPGNVLSGILGEIMINGGAEDPAPTVTESVTAKMLTATVTLPVGDTLNLLDQGHNAAAQYNLDAGTFDRDGTVAVTMFANIETVNLLAGQAANDVNIVNTGANTTTTVTTQDAADDVDVTTTGDGSILLINTAGGADTVDIAATGGGSVTIVNAGAGNDTLTLVASGANSGVALNGEAGDDTITVQNTGANSRTLLTGAAGADVFNVWATAAGSTLEAQGGANNDTFNLGSPANTLSGLLGEILIDGGAHDAMPTVTESVTAKMLTATVTLPVGDTLNLLDQGHNAAAAYNLTDGMFDRDGAVAITMFGEIETINLNAGQAANTVNIIDTPNATTTTVTTQDAADVVNVTTTGDGSILIVNTAGGADTVDIAATGGGSVTIVNAGAGNDTLTLVTSGANSGVALNGEAGDDTITVQNTGANSRTLLTGAAGADVFNIQGTAAGSTTDAFGGAGNDVFNISSNAPTNTGHLDNILGDICIFGEDNLAAPTSSLTIGGDTNTLAVGDILNISDSGAGAGHTYNLSATAFDRGAGVVTYETIETVNLTTSEFDDTVNVASTIAGGTTNIATLGGADTVNVTTTGDGSNVTLNTGAGADTATFTTTGVEAFTAIDAGLGADTVTLLSTGAASRTLAEGDDGDDTLELRSTGGAVGMVGAYVELNGDDGDDTLNIWAVARTGMVLDVVIARGNVGDDVINVGDPNLNSISGILGSLTVEGNDTAPMSPLREIIDSVTVANLPVGDVCVATPAELTFNTVLAATGDTLNVLDSGQTDSHGYTLDATTLTRNDLALNLVSFTYLTMQTVNVQSGSNDDEMAAVMGAMALPDVVTFDGDGGFDRLFIYGTAGDDRITIGDLGAATSSRFETANVAEVQAFAGSGNDQVIQSGATPLIADGAAGNDTLVGGTGNDVLLGGEGVDLHFGRAGNDIIFSDRDILGNVFADNGDVIDGGPGFDQAEQFGADFVFSIEVLVDGGACKDVLTWLRAQFVAALAFNPVVNIVPPQIVMPAPALPPLNPINLGAIDFVQLAGQAAATPAGQSTASSPAAYQFTPLHAPGRVTIELDDVGADATLLLLDASGRIVGGSRNPAGGERIDLDVATADPLTVVVLGGGNASLTIANVLTMNSPLTVHGTDGDDVVEIIVGDTYTIVFNGVRYDYDPAVVSSIHVRGNDGDDQVTISGRPVASTTVFGPGSAQLSGNGFVVHVNGVETTHYQEATAAGLVDRTLGAEPSAVYSWQNALDPMDVDGSGFVSMYDVLLIVSELRAGGIRQISHEQPNPAAPRYVDVNGDGYLTVNDALQVIARLRNELGSGEAALGLVEGGGSAAEGEAPAAAAAPQAAPIGPYFDPSWLLTADASDDGDDLLAPAGGVDDDLLDLLAGDIACRG